MGVSREKVVGFTINSDSTTSSSFFYFIKKLINNINKEEISNNLFFMDNLAAHKTAEMYKFYNDNKLKALF